jgi:hypothetical protein
MDDTNLDRDVELKRSSAEFRRAVDRAQQMLNERPEDPQRVAEVWAMVNRIQASYQGQRKHFDDANAYSRLVRSIERAHTRIERRGHRVPPSR